MNSINETLILIMSKYLNNNIFLLNKIKYCLALSNYNDVIDEINILKEKIIYCQCHKLFTQKECLYKNGFTNDYYIREYKTVEGYYAHIKKHNNNKIINGTILSLQKSKLIYFIKSYKLVTPNFKRTMHKKNFQKSYWYNKLNLYQK